MVIIMETTSRHIQQPAAHLRPPLPRLLLRGPHLPRSWKNGANIEINWKNLARSWTRSLHPLLPAPLPPPPPLTDQPGPQALQHQHLEVEGQGADGDLQGVLLQPLEEGPIVPTEEVILVKWKYSQEIKPVDSRCRLNLSRFRISKILQFEENAQRALPDWSLFPFCPTRMFCSLSSDSITVCAASKINPTINYFFTSSSFSYPRSEMPFLSIGQDFPHKIGNNYQLPFFFGFV